MAKFAVLNTISRETRMTSEFRGLDHALRAGDGTFSEMRNLTCDEYPVIATRKGRKTARMLGNQATWLQTHAMMQNAMYAGEKLAWQDGSSLYVDGQRVPGLVMQHSPRKTMVAMGAYLCVWPDMAYVNMNDLTDNGRMRYEVTKQNAVTATVCMRNGTEWYGTSMQTDMYSTDLHTPAGAHDGEVYCMTREEIRGIYIYNAAENRLEKMEEYVKIKGVGEIAAHAREGDLVKLEGFTFENTQTSMSPYLNDDYIQAVTEVMNAFAASDHRVVSVGSDYIVVEGFLPLKNERFIAGSQTISMDVPEMDYVIECNNRMWGCRYGMQDGQLVNEIYASALGNFRVWRQYEGLSTDSYAVSVGSPGPFTGAAVVGGMPVFFKEECMHRVSGVNPPYEVDMQVCRGVQKGDRGSICRVGEKIIYKARDCVCAYDGSMPVSISETLRLEGWGGACAGENQGKYYICMHDGKGKWRLLVYHDRLGLWTEEDDYPALAFARKGNELYAIRAAMDISDMNNRDVMEIVSGSEEPDEGYFEWEAVTGIEGFDTERHKYLSRFNLRMQLDRGAVAKLEIMYDSDGQWRSCGVFHGSDEMRTFMLPVAPRRCDHCRIKISGKGPMKLFSITRNYERGGDG